MPAVMFLAVNTDLDISRSRARSSGRLQSMVPKSFSIVVIEFNKCEMLSYSKLLPGTGDNDKRCALRVLSSPVVRPITLGTDPCAEHSLSNKQVVERAWRLVEWKVYLASTGRHGELDSRYTELNPRGQTRMPNLALIAVAGVYTCQRPGDGRRLALEGQASESIW